MNCQSSPKFHTNHSNSEIASPKSRSNHDLIFHVDRTKVKYYVYNENQSTLYTMTTSFVRKSLRKKNENIILHLFAKKQEYNITLLHQTKYRRRLLSEVEENGSHGHCSTVKSPANKIYLVHVLLLFSFHQTEKNIGIVLCSG